MFFDLQRTRRPFLHGPPEIMANPAATFPTQAMTTFFTQPAPISWSNWMSEIGPIRVSSFFFCRMISYPAAKGIRNSRPHPMATDAPSSTSRSNRFLQSGDLTHGLPIYLLTAYCAILGTLSLSAENHDGYHSFLDGFPSRSNYSTSTFNAMV